MPLPTKQQKAEAVAAHVIAVGGVHASAYEVALSLDARFPGMTDTEFSQLQMDLQDDIATARAGPSSFRVESNTDNSGS